MKRDLELDAHMIRVGMAALGGVAATVAHFKGRHTTDDMLPLAKRLAAGRRAVKGNRPAGSPVTPEDFTLLLASDLRILLAELENAT